MLDGIRGISIAACFYLATIPLGNSFTPQDSNRDPLAGDAAAQRTVTATERWLAGTMSTPGMAAQLREIARATVKGKLEVQYHIFVTGAPKDQTYTLIDWPPNAPDPSPSIAGPSVLEDGPAVCSGMAV